MDVTETRQDEDVATRHNENWAGMMIAGENSKLGCRGFW